MVGAEVPLGTSGRATIRTSAQDVPAVLTTSLAFPTFLLLSPYSVPTMGMLRVRAPSVVGAAWLNSSLAAPLPPPGTSSAA